MKTEELSFQREDVFHVWDTMYNGVIGSWHAQRVTKTNVETETGVVPNKCRCVSVMMMYVSDPPTHSFTHSLPHKLARSLTHLFTHLLTHLFT